MYVCESYEKGLIYIAVLEGEQERGGAACEETLAGYFLEQVSQENQVELHHSFGHSLEVMQGHIHCIPLVTYANL